MKVRTFLLRSGRIIQTDRQAGHFSEKRDMYYLSEEEFKIIFKPDIKDNDPYQCVYFDPLCILLTPISIENLSHSYYSDIVEEFKTKEELIAYILLNL